MIISCIKVIECSLLTMAQPSFTMEGAVPEWSHDQLSSTFKICVSSFAELKIAEPMSADDQRACNYQHYRYRAAD